MALMRTKIGKNTGDVNGDLTGRSDNRARLYYRKMVESKDILARIERRLEALGLSATEAERRAGTPEGIRNLRRAVRSGHDEKGVTSRTLTRLAKVLLTTDAWLFAGAGQEGQVYVPIVGHVGANPDGSVLFAAGQGTGSVAEIPPGCSSNCVALRVVGHSMRGFADDGALIYYDQRVDEPTPDMIGEPVVAELDTGEVLVKELHYGSGHGLFQLASLFGPTRRDIRLNWAARIAAVIPPFQAQKITRPEEDVAPREEDAAPRDVAEAG